MPSSSHLKTFLVMVLVGLAAAACVDEKIVYRDRELFEELPPGAAEFVGYTDMEAKLVVCGNCHVGQQGKWESTAHADAFETLVSSGHSQGFCESCHAVSELGNPITGSVGFAATQDERFHDVQCESCHGPAFGHPDDFEYLPLNKERALCMRCHSALEYPESTARSNLPAIFDRRHKRGRECVSCHNPHDPREDVE